MFVVDENNFYGITDFGSSLRVLVHGAKMCELLTFSPPLQRHGKYEDRIVISEV